MEAVICALEEAGYGSVGAAASLSVEELVEEVELSRGAAARVRKALSGAVGAARRDMEVLWARCGAC